MEEQNLVVGQPLVVGPWFVVGLWLVIRLWLVVRLRASWDCGPDELAVVRGRVATFELSPAFQRRVWMGIAW